MTIIHSEPAWRALWTGLLIPRSAGKKRCSRCLRPWEEEARWPLVVFVQGSAWRTPDRGYEIPQLSHLAQQGYVVATVCHRDSTQGNPFPAYLQDVKTAIRFLRAHAEEYGIDPEHVCDLRHFLRRKHRHAGRRNGERSPL